MRQSIDRFEEAIARDSSFARAHAGLAVALELLPYFSGVRAQDVRERAIASARRALALDGTLSEAYTALGLAHLHAYEWRRAEEAHRRAIELDANDASARIQYGRLLLYTGRLLDARGQFERARLLDPYSAVASGWHGRLLSLTGRNREGIAEITRALEIDSINPPVLFMATQAYLEEGDTATARTFADRLTVHVPSWQVPAAHLHALLGNREPALRLTRATGGTAGDVSGRPRVVFSLFLALGDTARAIDEMERLTDAGDFWPVYLPLSEPFFDQVRGNARFAAVVRRVGLDDRIFTSPTGGRLR